MQIQNLASITQKYPQFPTTLSSDLPHSDESHAFILYGTTLNLAKLLEFQQKCGQSFLCFDAWNVEKCRCSFKGKWLADFIAHAHDLQLDIAKLDFDAKLSEKVYW